MTDWLADCPTDWLTDLLAHRQDLRRDDFGGERLLSLSGSVAQVYNAAAEALEDHGPPPKSG